MVRLYWPDKFQSVIRIGSNSIWHEGHHSTVSNTFEPTQRQCNSTPNISHVVGRTAAGPDNGKRLMQAIREKVSTANTHSNKSKTQPGVACLPARTLQDPLGNHIIASIGRCHVAGYAAANVTYAAITPAAIQNFVLANVLRIRLYLPQGDSRNFIIRSLLNPTCVGNGQDCSGMRRKRSTRSSPFWR